MSSDARRDADRWLLWYAGGEQLTEDGRKNAVRTATLVIRALLASEPAKAPFVSRNEEWGLRPDFTTAGVPAPPAGAEPAKGACADCGGCGGLGWIPAGDEQLGCIDCNGKGTIEPAPPSGAEVREAAERLRSHIDSVWAITPEEFDSAGQPGVAKTIRLARRLLAALRATASSAPGSEGVREAVSENDVYTLIGHAEYLRKVRGEEDMPKFFDGLARRLLSALRGGQKGEGR